MSSILYVASEWIFTKGGFMGTATEQPRLKVSWISAVCLILLRNLARGKRCGHRDVAEELKQLKDANLRFSDLGLRAAPGGFMSEDALFWLWELYPMGYYKGDPHATGLILTDNGRKFCEEIVREEAEKNPEEFQSVAKALEADTLAISIIS
ncbi:MAG: hypothetical protein ABSE18_01025 [Minisyncoccia bacterium]